MTDKSHEKLIQTLQQFLSSSKVEQVAPELSKALSSHFETYENNLAELNMLKQVLELSGEGIFVIDRSGHIRLHNEMAQSLLGFDKSESLPKSAQELINLLSFRASDQDELAFQGEMLLSEFDKPCHGIVEFVNGNIIEHFSLAPAQGSETRIWCIRNVTAKSHTQRIVKHHIYHDSLTNLPNRLLLHDRLNHALAKAKRNDRKLAVLHLDLDNFKQINDTLGHEIGDTTLIAAARSLSQVLREQDTLARLGGDEFVILLETLETHNIASKICERLLEQLQNVKVAQAEKLKLSASIGISVYPSDGDNADALTRKSSLAMRHAKDTGKNQFQFFAQELERLAVHKASLESDLREAMDHNKLHLVFQPQIDVQTGKMDAVEALLRWPIGDGNYITPLEFIPIAEQSGLIIPLGYWVIEQVCQQLTQWQTDGIKDLRVAINLSMQQLYEKSLAKKLKQLLKKYNIDSGVLELEITETLLMKDAQNVISTLESIKQMGIDIAIDDFGTGYSSLSYLSQLPIHSLKIDKAFIKDMLEKEDGATIATAIINLGHDLGLKIVAEGVEDSNSFDYLKEHDCDRVQGFYFAKPVSAEQIKQYYFKQQQEGRFIF